MIPIFSATFTQRRSLILLSLGFASGLPLALTSGTLQAWMTVAGVDLKIIGFFSLVGQAYVFKFLWSPVMDCYSLPLLGRRRSWLVITQISLIAGLWLLGNHDPAQDLVWIATLAVWVAFCSASQDIAFDAYKTDLLPVQKCSTDVAVSVLGYRLAMLVSGGLALWVADYWLGWQSTYWLMAGLMLIGLISTLLAPEPEQEISKPANLEQAVVAPLREFFSRNNAWLILMIIILYKLGDAFTLSLSTTFLIRGVGFDPGQVGMINKSLGLLATIVGTLAGSLLMRRLSLFRSLLFFGLLQAVSNSGYLVLAITNKNVWLMATTIFIENTCGGMSTAAFVTLLMTLCNKSFSVTQFALLSALAAIGRVYVGPIAGWFVELHGWTWFYLFSVLLSFPGPGLLLLCRSTLAYTLHTGHFLRRSHFITGYRWTQRLLTISGTLLIITLICLVLTTTEMIRLYSMTDLFWKLGALLLSLSILIGCILDYLSMKLTQQQNNND